MKASFKAGTTTLIIPRSSTTDTVVSTISTWMNNVLSQIAGTNRTVSPRVDWRSVSKLLSAKNREHGQQIVASVNFMVSNEHHTYSLLLCFEKLSEDASGAEVDSND